MGKQPQTTAESEREPTKYLLYPKYNISPFPFPCVSTGIFPDKISSFQGCSFYMLAQGINLLCTFYIFHFDWIFSWACWPVLGSFFWLMFWHFCFNAIFKRDKKMTSHINRRMSRSKHLGGLVPVFRLGVSMRCKASKLEYPLRIPPKIILEIWQILIVHYIIDQAWGNSPTQKK